MGCWNETCLLTRTPISYGAPVMALTSVIGPTYRSTSNGQPTALLFGLPMAGKYDDYGDVDSLENPAYADFADAAFLNTKLYRDARTKDGHTSKDGRFVASSPRTLWGLEQSLKHLFYPRFGLTPSEADSYDRSARAKALEAFKACEAAVQQLGKWLRTWEHPEGENAFKDQLFAKISEIFGSDQAWSAWDQLSRKGLFARKQSLLLHRTAYDTVVSEFSARKVDYADRKQRIDLRTALQLDFDAWLQKYKQAAERKAQSRERYAALGLVDEDAEENGGDPDYAPVLYGGTCTSVHLQPLTSPWQVLELPLAGHFWGGATVEDVLAAHAHKDVMDFFVFQVARHYLRIELTGPSCGSQNQEVKLHHKMTQAVYRALREQGDFRQDFHPFFGRY